MASDENRISLIKIATLNRERRCPEKCTVIFVSYYRFLVLRTRRQTTFPISPRIRLEAMKSSSTQYLYHFISGRIYYVGRLKITNTCFTIF